jgi:hypothetical protein
MEPKVRSQNGEHGSWTPELCQQPDLIRTFQSGTSWRQRYGTSELSTTRQTLYFKLQNQREQ